MRSGTARLSAPRSTLTAASRGYATVAEEVAAPSASLFDQNIDMSPMEKGKAYYINKSYKRTAENIDIVRNR